MNTITAGDFTVEMDITKDMYDYYFEQHYDPKGKNLDEEDGNDKYSAALYLKKHLSEKLNKILTQSMEKRKSSGG